MSLTISESNVDIYPGQMVDILARITDKDGGFLSGSDFSAIALKIFLNGVAITLGGGPATSIAVATSQATNSLTTTQGWSRDNKGYNFSYSYNSASDLTGGNRYVMDIKLTTASHGIMHIIVNLNVKTVKNT